MALVLQKSKPQRHKVTTRYPAKVGSFCGLVTLWLGSTAMDGLLVIDKPAGFTSHDVIAAARRILKEGRLGHTGTLDPFATGVLLILVGRATRLAQFLSGSDKEYDAIIRLGFATDTGDRTGNPIAGPHGSADPSRTGRWSE